MTTEELHAAIANGDPVDGEDLSNVDWTDAQCAEAKFIRCRFIKCRFAHADFRGASFENCIFTDKAASTGSTFAFTELREARLIRCDLSFCHFDRSKLFDVQIARCSLIRARFTAT